MNRKYTHRDKNGMLWRFDGARPVSELADKVMEEVRNLSHTKLCSECGIYPGDPKICPGCQAYREHQS